MPSSHQHWGFYFTTMSTETLSEIHVSYKPGLISFKTISTSKEAFDILTRLFPQETICLQEQFVVLYLNRANSRYSNEITPVFRDKVPHLFRSKVNQPDHPATLLSFPDDSVILLFESVSNNLNLT